MDVAKNEGEVEAEGDGGTLGKREEETERSLRDEFVIDSLRM